MSFNQPQQQQTTTQVVETAGPQQTTTTKVTTTTIQQQQPAQQQQQRKARPTSSGETSQKQYSSGSFGHIRDNMDVYQRLDSAVANMSLRAPKAGDQFDHERKLEKRYDEEVAHGTPARILDWIGRVLHGQVPPPNGVEWKNVQLYLRDGTIICKLMNKLLNHAGRNPIRYRTKISSGFVALSNLEVFMAGAKEYGVPMSSLFQPSDLYEGRKGQLTNVIHCLNALGCVANARGFQPPYEEPPPPKADWCKDECYD